jgi:hypothetical protein
LDFKFIMIDTLVLYTKIKAVNRRKGPIPITISGIAHSAIGLPLAPFRISRSTALAANRIETTGLRRLFRYERQPISKSDTVS